jgi:DNA helicase-2/ATP-dependent DNA helicase PcrA
LELEILHGIDKNGLYDFIHRENPLEFSDDEFEYSKKQWEK